MDENVKQRLRDAGIDLEDALQRFLNNESLFERFIKKFLADANYAALVKAVDEGDTQKAFTAAHTLKGVCGNLSIKSVFETVSAQTELLRANNMEEAVKLMPELQSRYDEVCKVIAECFEK